MSPPARRSRSPYCRSAGHRLCILRMTLSRVRGWGSGFEWDCNFVRCLIRLSWMTSCTVGIPRSLWIMSLVTYRGASTIARNSLHWHTQINCNSFMSPCSSLHDLSWKPSNQVLFLRPAYLSHVSVACFGHTTVIRSTWFIAHETALCSNTHSSSNWDSRLTRQQWRTERGGVWWGSNPPRNSEVLTKSNRIANWAENV